MTKLRIAAAALTVALLAPPTLFAQEKPDYQQKPKTQIAKIAVEPDGLVMATSQEFESARLNVTGPYEWRQTMMLSPGQKSSIGHEDKGVRLPDGLYRYTITPVAKIDERTRTELRKARETGDNGRLVELNQKIERAEPQHGTFRILNGRFVDPTQEEPESGDDRDRGSLILPGSERADLSHKIYVAESAYRGPYHLASAAHGLPAGPYRARVGLLPDQVIADDLIVDGSLCVGFDCVNGEVFGFTTIRMKENNLRLDYDDTSTAASFPRNDWRLEANASANGGSSHFAIHDLTSGRQVFTIAAGTRSHAFFLDSQGDLGLGTSTPVVEIHTAAGDTPTLRLDQDGSGGWAPQIWDVAGNEASFFIRDATNGSQLPFRIRPGAPSSSIDIQADGAIDFGSGGSRRAEISSAGHFRSASGDEVEPGIAFEEEPGNGLYMPDPSRIEFSIQGQRAARLQSTGFRMLNGSFASPAYSFLNSPNSGFFRPAVGEVGFSADGSEIMRLTSTGLGIGVTAPTEPLEVSGNALADAHTTPSDARLKSNVRELNDALDLVGKLRGVRFEWNDDARNRARAGDSDVGVIAQEVLEIVPEVVSGSQQTNYSVDYARLIPILIEAIKEQQQRIELLEARIGS